MLHLHNTLTRKKEPFSPLSGNEVRMYTCGPTVYNYAHIGNLRSYLFADVLKRALVLNGYSVKHVMNITDVGHLASDADTGEDKMEKGAQREKKTVWQIAQFYTAAFQRDIGKLNILAPSVWCKATDHIKQQIEQIKKIEARGFTYRTSTGIYFDTSLLPDYGKLAGQSRDELKAGARIELDPEKKNPTDFALWKFSPPGVKRAMEWDSPWGKGFPGWHIECSAMAAYYLGQPFDIHTGGIDHIPIHHTNEIAQAEAAEGKPLAQFWIHGEFLVVEKGKMAKSEGNFLTLNVLEEKGYDPLAFRYFTFTAHYRKQLAFSWEGLDAAQNALNSLRTAMQEVAHAPAHTEAFSGRHCDAFQKAVNNDLNIPEAMAVVWDLIKSNRPAEEKKATLLFFDRVLGLSLADIQPRTTKIPQDILALAHKREQLRKEKKWDEADAIRDEILSRGYLIEDMPNGTKITPA